MLLSKIADWPTYCTLLPSNISLEQKHYDHICSLWMCFDGNKSAQPHHKPTFSHPNARLTWWNVFFNFTKMFRTLLWSTSYRNDYCCSAGTIISVEFYREDSSQVLRIFFLFLLLLLLLNSDLFCPFTRRWEHGTGIRTKREFSVKHKRLWSKGLD